VEEVEDGATAVVATAITEEADQEDAEEEITTQEPQQLPPSIEVCAPLLAIMSLIMARREQLTKCVRLGKRSYITSEQYMGMILVMNSRIANP
jgi:hypothetical protein